MAQFIGYGFSQRFTPKPTPQRHELTCESLEEMLRRMQASGFAPVDHIQDAKVEEG